MVWRLDATMIHTMYYVALRADHRTRSCVTAGRFLRASQEFCSFNDPATTIYTPHVSLIRKNRGYCRASIMSPRSAILWP